MKNIILIFLLLTTLKALDTKIYQYGKVVQIEASTQGQFSYATSRVILDSIEFKLNSVVNMDSKYYNSSYKYEVVANNKVIYSGGYNNTHTKLEFKETYRNQWLPSHIHELRISDKVIGWLYGWNKHSYYTYGTDFSVARLIIPMKDGDKNYVYTKYLEGLKFQDIADLLSINDNELKIVPTKDEQSIFGSGAATGYYYLPATVISIKDINGQIKVSEEDIKITDELINNNPYYAFSMAYHNNDISSMKKAYKLFKSNLPKELSNKCQLEQKDLSKFIDNGYISLEKYWKSFDNYYEVIHNLSQCLNTGPEEYIIDSTTWNILNRTGVIPTQKFIDEFFEKSLKGQ